MAKPNPERAAQQARKHLRSPQGREATQRFAILNVLVDYTGTQLTPTVIENIMAGIETEMRSGACSWAFKPQEAP